MEQRLEKDFFLQSGVDLAKALLGKVLVRAFDDGSVCRYKITATEAYCGTADKACHASKGRTARTEVMFGVGGYVYVYLIYGMYWMFNVVANKIDVPEAVLICGLDDIVGSGRVGRELQLNKSFYGENLSVSSKIWIENAEDVENYRAFKRKGIDYAEEWRDKLWRFEIF